MKVNYPNRITNEPYSNWQTGCVCGHVKCEHFGGIIWFSGKCKKCQCPKFKKDKDGVYDGGFYVGSESTSVTSGIVGDKKC